MKEQYYVDTVLSLVNDFNKHYRGGTHNIVTLYITHYTNPLSQARELEEFCFRFSLNHMTSVTQTEAFAKLDEGTVKDFIMKAAQSGAFKS